MVHGLRSLERNGFDVLEGEVVTKRARAVKGPDEILWQSAARKSPVRWTKWVPADVTTKIKAAL